MSLSDMALHYASTFGWSVHPVNVKKQPITPHGRNDATRNEQTIKKWFKNGAQIGVATGKESNLFVLDIDYDEQRGINGYETLEYLESIHGKLPETPQQRTGRGGTQYLFRYAPGLKNTSGKIGMGIDTRGDGGYIVVAPSKSTYGPYEWLVLPDDIPLADPPQWIIEALREAEKPATPQTNGNERSYCQKMLGQAVARVATATDGQKHKMLLKMARWLGGFVPMLSEEEIESALFAAVELRAADHHNARKTIRDGIAYGMQQPLGPPKERPKREYVNTQTGEIIDPRPAPIIELVVDWRQQGITLRELQHKHFEPEKWIIERILPEGACLLAAKYKSYKSWLCLGLGLAISMGGKAIGQLEVTPGRVLYLDLEGKQQRIKKRTRAILGVQQIDWPDNFHIFTKWPQGSEGIKELENWFSSYPDTVYVCIDVLGDFRRPIDKHEMGYQYDRDTVIPINELCERYHAASHLVHHFNKAKNIAGDIMDSISGTTGLPSAVNTMWGLSKDINDSKITILSLRGRDLENDEPIALRWDDYLNLHVIEGPAREVSIGAERKAILEILSDDQARTPKEIASELGRSVDNVKQLLRKLLTDGLVEKPQYGMYARVLTDHSDHSDHGGYSDHADHSVASAVHSLRNDTKSAQDLHKSDRHVQRVIGDISTDHSCLAHQESSNDKSDRSDRYIEGDDFSIDCVQIADKLVWRLWHDPTDRILGAYETEQQARDAIVTFSTKEQ